MSDTGHMLFETGPSLNADESRPVAPETLKRLVGNIETLQAAQKQAALDVKEAFEEAKIAGIKMKPFKIFLRNRQRSREEVSEELRIAEGYQDMMEGRNLRV